MAAGLCWLRRFCLWLFLVLTTCFVSISFFLTFLKLGLVCVCAWCFNSSIFFFIIFWFSLRCLISAIQWLASCFPALYFLCSFTFSFALACASFTFFAFTLACLRAFSLRAQPAFN